MTERIQLRDRDGLLVAHALVDDDDADFVRSMAPWHLQPSGYVAHSGRTPEGKPTVFRLHRVVLGLITGDGVEVDHLNGDKLDNRQCNLRAVTHQLNIQNRQGHRGSRSRYRGVDWHKARGKWRARVHIDGRTYDLGLFADEHDAAQKAHDFRLRYMAGALN